MILTILLFIPLLMIGGGFLWQWQAPRIDGSLHIFLGRYIQDRQLEWNDFWESMGRRWIWLGLALGVLNIILMSVVRGSNLMQLLFVLIIGIGIEVLAWILSILISIYT